MTRLLAALIPLLLPATLLFAEDWPGWRGPRGDGSSHDKKAPLDFSPTKNVAWKADLPGVGFTPPQGTYLAWLDLRSYGLGDNPAEVLLDKAGVALSAGPDFGVHGLGHARLNFATSAPILDQVVDRLAAALA